MTDKRLLPNCFTCKFAELIKDDGDAQNYRPKVHCQLHQFKIGEARHHFCSNFVDKTEVINIASVAEPIANAQMYAWFEIQYRFTKALDTIQTVYEIEPIFTFDEFATQLMTVKTNRYSKLSRHKWFELVKSIDEEIISEDLFQFGKHFDERRAKNRAKQNASKTSTDPDKA